MTKTPDVHLSTFDITEINVQRGADYAQILIILEKQSNVCIFAKVFFLEFDKLNICICMGGGMLIREAMKCF